MLFTCIIIALLIPGKFPSTYDLIIFVLFSVNEFQLVQVKLFSVYIVFFFFSLAMRSTC